MTTRDTSFLCVINMSYQTENAVDGLLHDDASPSGLPSRRSKWHSGHAVVFPFLWGATTGSKTLCQQKLAKDLK